MKNLRQAKAALPVNDNSDDDIDDMPFISSKQARARVPVKRQTPNLQESAG